MAAVMLIIIKDGIENIIFHFRLRPHHRATHPEQPTSESCHYPLQEGSGVGYQDPERDGRMSCHSNTGAYLIEEGLIHY